MEREGLRARLAERLRAWREEIMTKPDREAVRDFMSEFVHDWGGEDEFRAELRRAMRPDPWRMGYVLRSFEAFMADPPRDGTLAWLVEGYGNWGVDHGTDEKYLEILDRLLRILREEYAGVASPPGPAAAG
ncbi:MULTISPECIES: hypothetical protein [Catenuloplanes]|uniref:CdiI immunity protein domain-containing protein n=1 Tax=Catenuloplanes niger TaxID=587534 RepID=A0AAE3ZNR2_9ACTN|nr:hypothetical protein [Catenuloplanes niger]MDR7322277.1 hypothetical protein [Catenuloplanes niger]